MKLDINRTVSSSDEAYSMNKIGQTMKSISLSKVEFRRKYTLANPVVQEQTTIPLRIS